MVVGFQVSFSFSVDCMCLICYDTSYGTTDWVSLPSDFPFFLEVFTYNTDEGTKDG